MTCTGCWVRFNPERQIADGTVNVYDAQTAPAGACGLYEVRETEIAGVEYATAG